MKKTLIIGAVMSAMFFLQLAVVEKQAFSPKTAKTTNC